MSRTKGVSALLLVIIIAVSCVALLTVKPADAQTLTPTPFDKTFSYHFPSGYEFYYRIVQTEDKSSYIIAPLNLDNSYPIEFGFYEILPNGNQQHVTHIFPARAYGSQFFSTSYPTSITLTELTNPPTTTPSTTINPTTSPTPTISVTANPGNEQLTFFAIISAAIIALLAVFVYLKHRETRHN